MNKLHITLFSLALLTIPFMNANYYQWLDCMQEDKVLIRETITITCGDNNGSMTSDRYYNLQDGFEIGLRYSNEIANKTLNKLENQYRKQGLTAQLDLVGALNIIEHSLSESRSGKRWGYVSAGLLGTIAAAMLITDPTVTAAVEQRFNWHGIGLGLGFSVRKDKGGLVVGSICGALAAATALYAHYSFKSTCKEYIQLIDRLFQSPIFTGESKSRARTVLPNIHRFMHASARVLA